MADKFDNTDIYLTLRHIEHERPVELFWVLNDTLQQEIVKAKVHEWRFFPIRQLDSRDIALEKEA